LDVAATERAVSLSASIRERSGNQFILGVGSSASNVSPGVNDFRKLAGIEVYAPTD